MITIVDYGTGNYRSIANMLRRIGYESVLSGDPGEISRAGKLVLPGVGAFDTAMRRLEELGLAEVLHRRVREEGIPILGICLGMQLFSRGSEEGRMAGLGWIAGEVVRFRPEQSSERLRVPHMGWNYAVPARETKLLAGTREDARYYFVHAYHLRMDRDEEVLSTTTHGYPFVSGVEAGNVMGVQFHPEKSHTFGMQVLKNFVERY